MEYLTLLANMGAETGLAPGVALVEDSGAYTVRGRVAECPVPAAYRLLDPVLRRLAGGPVGLDALSDDAAERHSVMGVVSLYRLLHHLAMRGLLLFRLPGLLDIQPLSHEAACLTEKAPPGARHRLSRFSFFRHESGLWLESARNPVRVRLEDRGLRNLLLDGGDMDGEAVPPAWRDGLDVLRRYGFLVQVPESAPDSGAAGSDDPAVWEFHDLLLHGRSRLGRQAAGFGPTYRFREVMAAPPPLEDPHPGPPIPLPRPDVAAFTQRGPSFFAVTEGRASCRRYASTPLSLRQLGHLFFLAARVKGRYDAQWYEATQRPYPGAGALYEFALYLTAVHVEGLAAGTYHYDPAEHALRLVAPLDERVARLLDETRLSAQCGDFSALLSLGARFRRVMWKYEALAYSLILKDCGVFLHHFCLAASALGLGSCILGAGSADLLSRITGRSWLEESAVGELIFGVADSGAAGKTVPERGTGGAA